ncbi:MAG: type II toxin-antitoxin system VapB family antitoxin [Firmicutes bacterium]|nr:type II toxin-antitoxin system VapB family antitoxin [Bacillota bacterium]
MNIAIEDNILAEAERLSGITKPELIVETALLEFVQRWKSKAEIIELAEKSVKSPPLTFDDICKPLISTKSLKTFRDISKPLIELDENWKFDREEVNAR